ncbi:dioxygenase family protein [Rhizosphaericola mali]|uniref:Dioxygenase n=1 Tax=Rhizosphaericola mali TaxID=2545455 RepID=A0A5P2G5S9_9BACT|nr:class III extradiol ring-cleavage dioxygenase [Rhizosphaericola mali]QES90597.1 dioxygenase [Rhizosphaericola mali]
MHRKEFLKMMAILPLLKSSNGLAQLLLANKPFPVTERMPVFFVGHQDFSKTPHQTPFTKNLRTMGASVTPIAILVMSAHWLTLGDTFVNLNSQFSTPEYPSKGAPEIGKLIMNETNTKEEQSRDLDHGAWSVLRHLSPDAKVPVLELSIDMSKPLDYHYQLARQLSNLRTRGVLIVGSGNIVHNLDMSALKFWSSKPYDWAMEFDNWVKDRIDERDFSSLFQFEKLGKVADYSVPTMDHYLPMLYCLSLCESDETITHTFTEVTRGLSFRCFRIS